MTSSRPASPGSTNQTALDASNTGVRTTYGPNDITVMERFVCDPTWPNDLILDPDVGNWRFWSFKMRICADKTGVRAWLNGTQPRPDPVLYPKAHRIWETTDLSLRAFIIEHISPSIIDEVLSLDTAYEVYEHLHKHHKRQGLYT
jgi:hypothetical protein